MFRQRVALAQRLMLTTEDSMCQIALACGMCDQAHLTRVFRRIVGESPTAWRRLHAVGPAPLSAPTSKPGHIRAINARPRSSD